MSASGVPLGSFVVRVLLWLPPCFAAWHFAAPYHAAIAGGLARALVNLLHPGIVSAVERAGALLAFVTTVEMPGAPGQFALLVVEVNPRVYTYGLALLAALVLAARARAWKLLAGAALLLPFQAWGIAFDFLSQVGITLGPEVAARAGISAARREAIVLGYQAGALMLPALAPVLCWALLCRTFIEGLLRSGVRYRTDAAGSSA